MKTAIYYFTGTGNSLKIAKDLGKELNSQLIRISKQNLAINKDENDRVGFVFPVYYWGLPHMFKQFVENLEIRKDAYVFAVSNFGNNPGLSHLQLNEIVVSKGVKLSSAFGVSMPGNMWSMHYSHYTKKDINDRIAAQHEATVAIAAQIAIGVEIPVTDDIENQRKEEELYRNFAPNRADEHFWADDICNGCGICVQLCPSGNIDMIEDKPVWRHKCEFCLACMHWCPLEAIEYKNDSVEKERYRHPDIRMKELFQKRK
ncbi:EFR1 family ferrodoxin [bacterium]|nr:EFR1 family ferrodoxin [bacterium]